MDRQQARALLEVPGGMFEVVTEEVNGRPAPVFKQRERTMRETVQRVSSCVGRACGDCCNSSVDRAARPSQDVPTLNVAIKQANNAPWFSLVMSQLTGTQAAAGIPFCSGRESRVTQSACGYSSAGRGRCP